MKRHLFNLLATTSLVLCLATVALCVRSQFTRDTVSWGRAGGSLFAVSSKHERLSVICVQNAAEDRAVEWMRRPSGEMDLATQVAWGSKAGLSYQSWIGLEVTRGQGWLGPPPWDSASLRPIVVVDAAMGQLMLLTAAAPLAWLSAYVFRKLLLRRRRQRHQRGRCTACGYDLTGNVSGRCPECGTLAFVEEIDLR